MKNLKIIALVYALTFLPLVAGAQTWTPPTSAPPSGNVFAPLNVSGTAQTKAGGLLIGTSAVPNGLLVQNGNVGIGTLSPAEKLTVDNGNVLVKNFNNPKITLSQSASCTNGDCWQYGASIGMKYEFGHSFSLTGLAGAELLGQYNYNIALLPAAGGNVGIGTTVPAARLTVVGPSTGASTVMSVVRGAGGSYWNLNLDNNNLGFSYNTASAGQEKFVISSLGNVGVGVLSPANKLQVAGDVGANAYFYLSDRNLKKNISPLANSLSTISKLEGISFNWKDTGEKSMGLVAQDVEKVYPELVSTNPETGIKSVQYGNLVAPLIEAIKEQQKQIDALKAEVEALKARN